jgi:gliding motility-associated lipoprotein GldB
MKYIHTFSICLFCAFLFSCSSNSCDDAPDVSGIEMDVEIQRLDQELFAANNKEEIGAFLDRYPKVAERFMNAAQYPNDSILVNQIYTIINDPNIDTLYQQTQAAFGELDWLEREFEQAFRYIKHDYPDYTPPKIYAAFSALGSFGLDLFVSDEIIVISLEHFIGEEARYRPQVYDYILARYRPEYIVPNCVLLLSNRWNMTNEQDNTLLAEMIYYGKSYYFTDKMMPCLPDTILAAYTTEELQIAEESAQLVWSHFINQELLYETSHIIKPRYMGERPAVVEINARIPGRIGRWLGWQIVETYAEKTGAALPEIMKIPDAQEIFTRARYKP